jgi:L-lactate dehydrogenase complex protein LldE
VQVGLFVTCLVDLFRPSIGFAALKLLEGAGCEVVVPVTQTCCGQPGYNAGDRRGAQTLARKMVQEFAACEHVVVPSGSCAGMIRTHYQELLSELPELQPEVERLAARTYELTDFLHNVLKVSDVPGRWQGLITYHDSCSGLRELGVKAQPRRLLASVDGLCLAELPGAELCCGFGGTFCVKYPEISDKMVGDKAVDIAATGSQVVLAGDLGCLLNIAGKLTRLGVPVETRHVAEVLAGMADEIAPIGVAKAK